MQLSRRYSCLGMKVENPKREAGKNGLKITGVKRKRSLKNIYVKLDASPKKK